MFLCPSCGENHNNSQSILIMSNHQAVFSTEVPEGLDPTRSITSQLRQMFPWIDQARRGIELHQLLEQTSQTSPKSLQTSKIHVSKMPVFKYSQTMMEYFKMFFFDNNTKGCAICLCDFENDESLIYCDCGHLFHDECMKKWMRENNKCALCNFKFPLEDIENGNKQNEMPNTRTKRELLLKRINSVVLRVVIFIWNNWTLDSKRLVYYEEKMKSFYEVVTNWTGKKILPERRKMISRIKLVSGIITRMQENRLRVNKFL